MGDCGLYLECRFFGKDVKAEKEGNNHRTNSHNAGPGFMHGPASAHATLPPLLIDRCEGSVSGTKTNKLTTSPLPPFH